MLMTTTRPKSELSVETTERTAGQQGSTPQWQCNYQADEAMFLAPDHTFFAGMSLARDMSKFGRAVLNLRIDMNEVSSPRLRDARLRVSVRHTRGTALLDWESATLDQMHRPAGGAGLPVWLVLRLDAQACQSMQPDTTYRLCVTLEDAQGRIIDDAMGSLVFGA